MKIGVFSEGGYQGKVPRNHPNMRTDMALWCALGATHHPLNTLHTSHTSKGATKCFILVYPPLHFSLLVHHLLEL